MRWYNWRSVYVISEVQKYQLSVTSSFTLYSQHLRYSEISWPWSTLGILVEEHGFRTINTLDLHIIVNFPIRRQRDWDKWVNHIDDLVQDISVKTIVNVLDVPRSCIKALWVSQTVCSVSKISTRNIRVNVIPNCGSCYRLPRFE